MAIAHYGSVSHNYDWVLSGTKSFTVDCGAGTDRILLALAYLDRNAADGLITAATYNGVSMTAGTAFYETAGGTGREFILFYLTNPAANSNTLTISVGSDSVKCGVVTAVYTGVKQDVAPGSITTRNSLVSSGATASFSQATNSGETAVWMHYSFDVAGSSKYSQPGSSTWAERLDNYALVIDKDADPSTTTVTFVNNAASIIAYTGAGMGLVPVGGGEGMSKTTKLTLLGVG